MSTPPVTSVTEELIAELDAAAKGAKGWQLGQAFQVVEEGYSPDEWYWHVGRIDEDDNQYPVLLVDTAQWDQPQDAECVARYYAAVNRDTILALLAERAELRRDAEIMRRALEQLAQVPGCGCDFPCRCGGAEWARAELEGRIDLAIEALEAMQEAKPCP